MAALGMTRERQVVLALATVLLLAAVVALALTARSARQQPEPLAGLSEAQVSLARSEGLVIRVNAIATEARSSEAEEVAVAALGAEIFERLRDEVAVSLARVSDPSGQRLAPGLVWVVFADGVTAPPLGQGASAGVPEPARTFVVVDPDSLETLKSVVGQ